MRSSLWLALLLVAGCLGAAPSPGAATGTLPTLELHGCENLGAALPTPLDEAQARLPPGFEAVPSRALPQPTALMYVIGLRCQNALVDGVAHGETLLAYAELDVRPPASERVAGIEDYVVPVRFTAPGAVGEALAAMHLGRAGPGAITRAAATPLDVAFAVDADNVSFQLRGALTGSAGAPSQERFVVFGVQDGQLVSRFVGDASKASGARTGPVALTASGDPLLEQAQPATTGFAVGGFDLTFAPR